MLQRLSASLVKLIDGTTLSSFIDRVYTFINKDSYRQSNDVRGFISSDNLAELETIMNAGVNKGQFKIPAGTWQGGVLLKSGYGLQGDNLISTVVVVPRDKHGISYAEPDIRGIRIANMAMQVKGAVTGGAPIGSKCGMDFTGSAKVVNCTFENLYLDFFDIGYNAGPADFSNYYKNVRCNNNRIGFNIVSNGTIIQNTWDDCYVANWTAYGMLLRGASNQVFNNMNFGHNGSSGAYFLHIDRNSRGILFNAPNFEMDAGMLTPGTQGCLIASDSEVTFNSPVFNKCKTTGPNTYLMKVRGTAVVTINNPQVYNGDDIIGHLLVEDNAVVYLNDPKGAFKVIKTSGNGKVVNVSKAHTNVPEFAELKTVKTGDIITIGFYPKHVEAQCNYAASGVVGSEKYLVLFDSYTSTHGTVTARVVDFTTGNVVNDVSRSVFVQAWK